MYQSFYNIWFVFSGGLKIILLGETLNLIQESEMFWHICVQNVVDDVLPDTVEFLSSEGLKDIAFIVIDKEEEGGTMVIF